MATPRQFARSFSRTTIVIVFVLAQLVLACHRADIVEHVAGEPCEWCIAGTSLPLADVFDGGVFDARAHVLVAVFSLCVLAVATVRAYRSRAPPRRSFVVS